MDFEKAVSLIGTVTDLRRIASAHVIDHNQLKDEELRSALVKSKPQYTASETVRKALDDLLSREPKDHIRALNRIVLVDVLLDQYDCQLPFEETDAKVTAIEQGIIDRSNEIDLEQLACGDKGTPRYRDIETYNFVLGVAWEQRDSVSPDEANLLANLRRHLRINQFEHRVLEAKLRRFPKSGNELHTRSEITAARRSLHQSGLLFAIRQEGADYDLIPDELAAELRVTLGLELRTDAYRELLKFWKVRTKAHLTDVLERHNVAFAKSDKVEGLVERVVLNVPPSKAIASASPRYGLSGDELSDWCRDLNLSPSGPIEDKVRRVVAHFFALRPRVEAHVDERSFWYDFYAELACRNRELLRSQHVIEKDLEMESKFEHATQFLFQTKLGHTPLKQSGTDHPDGLLSLRSDYLIWDNKSKDPPGLFRLEDCITQFDRYMNGADKRVPIFLVIAPAFTDESEVEAIRYHAEHFDRNIVLITAGELKALADEWASPQHKNRETPFPLGLLAASGRYDRRKLGKLTS
ncbi:MAG: hypothetical protein QM756_42640 [Polyangiaceae bacterium]